MITVVYVLKVLKMATDATEKSLFAITQRSVQVDLARDPSGYPHSAYIDRN